MLFKNFNLTDDEVEDILKNYRSLINRYSEINGVIDKDLRQEIMMEIYISLTQNREKFKKI
ncbi:MAG: helix-turn-helix domain-containing protein [Clostridia bacterium]|nr:helix-turn-helix domain-containing protein [Clostridia bacterium]